MRKKKAENEFSISENHGKSRHTISRRSFPLEGNWVMKTCLRIWFEEGIVAVFASEILGIGAGSINPKTHNFGADSNTEDSLSRIVACSAQLHRSEERSGDDSLRLNLVTTNVPVSIRNKHTTRQSRGEVSMANRGRYIFLCAGRVDSFRIPPRLHSAFESLSTIIASHVASEYEAKR